MAGVFQIKSPKDGFVVTVSHSNGQAVSAGDVIVELDSTEESLKRSRVLALENLRAAFAERLQSPLIDATQRLASIAVSIAKVEKDAVDLISRNTDIRPPAAPANSQNMVSTSKKLNGPDDDRITLGPSSTGLTWPEYVQVRKQQDQAPLALESATHNQTLLVGLLNQLSQANNIIADHLVVERAAAEALISSMSVRSPVNGKINLLNVVKGMFVTKGDVLFTIAS